MTKVYKVWKLNLQIKKLGLKLNSPSACYSATKPLSISVICLIVSSQHWLLTSNLLLISHKICTALKVIFSSVQSLTCVWLLWPHELQHARPPCPSPTPRVHPNPSPLSQWFHPAISSSVIPFSFCPQSFPASGSSQMSQLFVSGGQSIGVSAQHQSFQWTPRTDLF